MIDVTPVAAQKILGIMDEQGEKDASLRIVATGVSCSGPQFMMTLEHDTQEDDTLLEAEGLRILVDQETVSILDGSQIDYLEGLERSGFTITNPNSQGGGGGCGGNCSCGR